ncbi:MAG: YraN family protein [Alphaproteobacteria bacterium]|nr:YraN family protein [Alphaproteobacteria bacterium]
MNNKTTGSIGEFLARSFLRLKGYRIVEKNYVTGRGVGCGELDIVACKRHTLVFVEVKSRQNMTDALSAIKNTQQKRIVRAAEVYLARHKKWQGFDVRFDAIFVSGWRIRHIKNMCSADV